MADRWKDGKYFTVTLPQRVRPGLSALAKRSVRSFPQVLEVLIEQALRQPELVGVPSLLEAQRDNEQQGDAA